MSIRQGSTFIAGRGSTLPSQTGKAGKYLKTDGTTASWEEAAGAVETDNLTINENASSKLQAIGLIDKNTNNAKYDWVGTLAQYNALSSYNNNWTYFITDDYSNSITIDDSSITRNTNNELQTVGIKETNASQTIKTWVGTKSQYDAITTKDNNTIYNVTDEGNPFQDFLNVIWPVGSIVLSCTEICPVAALIGVWSKIGTKLLIDNPSSVPVKGNGMTLGVTNGTTNYGLSPNGGSEMLIGFDGLYGTNVGSTTTGSTHTSGIYSMGVTTDSTKSGIVADLSSVANIQVNIFKRIS